MLNDYIDIDYHMRQREQRYRSTEMFCAFVEKYIYPRGNILDVACGAGGNTEYMQYRWCLPGNAYLWGIDINQDFIDIAKKECVRSDQAYSQWDITNPLPSDYRNIEGIVCLQSLFAIENMHKAILNIVNANPGWIALSVLANDNDVTYHVDLMIGKNGTTTRAKYFIQTIDWYKEFFMSHGYKEFYYEPFDIDIDLPKPEHKSIGTYTEKLEDGRRLQISAGLLMNWYFILAKK